MRDKDNDEIVLGVFKSALRLLELAPRTMYTKDVVLPTIEQIKLAEISVYDRIVDAVVSRKQGNQAISMAQGYLLFEHNNGIINVGGEDGR